MLLRSALVFVKVFRMTGVVTAPLKYITVMLLTVIVFEIICLVMYF